MAYRISAKWVVLALLGAVILSYGGPAVADAFRFRSNEKLVDVVGAFIVPIGTVMSLIAPLVFTSPVAGLISVHPWTRSPVDVSRFPALSTWRLPPRV